MSADSHRDLVAVLSERFGEDLAVRHPDLEGQLARLVDDASSAWPGVRVDGVRFIRYVVERLPKAGDLPSALGKVSARGLYLACACADGDPAAIATVDSRYLADVKQALGRLADVPGLADEVRQEVRVKLFVAGHGEQPKIADYRGTGELGTFLRVLLMRQAISQKRKTWREVPLDTSAGPTPDAWVSGDPELVHLRQAYAGEFQSAFADAVRGLTSEDRNLLRYHYLDALNIDQIGAIYGIHRVTAARRLTKVREALVAETRVLLSARFKLRSGELESVLRLIDGAVDVSLRAVLGQTLSVAAAP